MREFESGANRDSDEAKLDYEGCLSPNVLMRFAEYMREHQHTASGLRDSDNWQKGIPLKVYMKSLSRHYMDLWLFRRGAITLTDKQLEDTVCAIMFNVQGYLFETLKQKDNIRAT